MIISLHLGHRCFFFFKTTLIGIFMPWFKHSLQSSSSPQGKNIIFLWLFLQIKQLYLLSTTSSPVHFDIFIIFFLAVTILDLISALLFKK